jgi:DNA helicase HerA-like ATPase
MDQQVSGADIGFIVSVGGSQAVARLVNPPRQAGASHHRLTIGRLAAVRTQSSLVIGVIARLTVSPTGSDDKDGPSLAAEIDLLGEIRNHGTPKAFFQRGVTDYPTIGDRIIEVGAAELTLIHSITHGETIGVGTLQLDGSIPAYVNFDELLSKHFAILGTTGVGKSTAVSLLLHEILEKGANLRVFLIDPHNEYGGCFGDMAKLVSPKNLRLPYWLFSFEEIVDVFFRGRPGVEEETEILAELIPVAKAQYALNTRGDRILLRRTPGGGHTADTPIPYRISDLTALISERMGKLENRSSWIKYHRLVTRIESLGHDSRYAFMFNNLFVEDIMADVIGELFRLPPNGQPITVMQLAGFPAEVVDAVVSVLCRMVFDFGTWSDGAAPILVACEEAHRYVPADPKLGFGPTRKALSRIAKEGRKYGVFLAAVTQRPAELDPTILSQCSTVFAMRMANDRDQAIVRSAIPDAGSSLLDFLPSLGTAEAIVFGEGVALPTRFRFSEVPAERLPHSQSGAREHLKSTGHVDVDFIAAVVDRWREATTTTMRPRLSPIDHDKPASEARAQATYVPDAADFR